MMYQKLFDDFVKNSKNNKVVIYGAGIYSFSIIVHNDLSKINIVGVVDKKFENQINQKFFNIPAGANP